MGAYDALRNLAIMLFLINLGATLAGAIFPDFALAMQGEQVEQLTENMQSQIDTIQPSSTSTIGDLVTAFGLALTFFKNLLTGNYYVWKALGLDKSITITSTGVIVKEGGLTFAHVLGSVGVMIYVLGIIEFIRGRV
ncbi:MAG: hypothetical protein H0Z18_09195 [Thermococcus sp.]|uniref:hypothetical protein n=1 Tax=Thermococcus sp. TaxID=35749 RepID=UPI001E0A6782|nr:hypothetical protein [Thermococcus sp.]MBO8175419.1 hypothetical protein [Thermococcus sp.]